MPARKRHGDFSYDSRRWRSRSEQYRREHPYCEPCRRAGRVALSKHVDHIVPIVQGCDPWDESNWEAKCITCHSRKTRADQSGQPMVEKGCGPDGMPLDPRHHWTKDG